MDEGRGPTPLQAVLIRYDGTDYPSLPSARDRAIVDDLRGLGLLGYGRDGTVRITERGMGIVSGGIRTRRTTPGFLR
ncbi:MAG: hypothetical protein IJ026_02420 [Candidatus Methanomethylophilaceae archaeon]|nr:hypothetical protein [Candidatus Methanomethylophilaceae archaeon]